MPADERIRVTLKRLYVSNAAEWFGSGEFYFKATIDGAAIGDPNQIFDGRKKEWTDLDATTWSAVVDVSNGKPLVEVTFHGYDKDAYFDDLGSITLKLRPPWVDKGYNDRVESKYFTLEWRIEPAVDGKFGVRAPDEVFAARSPSGAAASTTVDASPLVMRLEFHPVVPLPPDSPVRRNYPPRPQGLTGTAKQNDEIRYGIPISPASPINVLPNPAVIPILSPPGSTPSDGAPPVADPSNAARIVYSYYQPDSLAFTDNDPRLEWNWHPLAGGAVDFVGPPNGLKTLVYGTAPGEVLLIVKYKGTEVATYRALVLPVKKIPARFNILNGPTPGSRPLSTPADIVDHVAIANRYLRQAALELVFDTDPTVTDGAQAVAGYPGIFRISVAAGDTRQIRKDGHPKATQMNHRDFVANFAYVHSDAAVGVLGRATDRGASRAGTTISDTGTPSSSWNSPTGIPPDQAAGTLTMPLAPPLQDIGASGSAKYPNLYAMYLTNGLPQYRPNAATYGHTMAHEFCHILNLQHRTSSLQGGDGIQLPTGENLMTPMGMVFLAQDIDIIQARAMHQSPLVPP